MTTGTSANVTYLHASQTAAITAAAQPITLAEAIRDIATTTGEAACWQALLTAAMNRAGAESAILHEIHGDDIRPTMLRLHGAGIAYGGDAAPSPFPARELRSAKTGRVDLADLACRAALEGGPLHLEGHEALLPYDRTTGFLASLGSRVSSAIVMPVTDDQGRTRAILSLFRESRDGAPATFDPTALDDTQALVAIAEGTQRTQRLKGEQREFFRSLVRMMTAAINAKSPYTGAHCQRIPVIYDLLARAAIDSEAGPFADFHLDEDGLEELAIAAWLHDCGKVATPEHVVDKATRLETVHDRIDEVCARFEILKREVEITCLKKILRHPDKAEKLRARMYDEIGAIDDDLAFLVRANHGETFMTEPMLARVKEVATRTWRDHEGLSRPLLSEEEVTNLSIRIGTLTQAERRIINRHVEVSYEMLRELPFPEELSRVTEIAAEHHEKINGTGYPKGLTGDQMSIPSRMLVIADIFEALTAGDRPYKRGKTLSEALSIMARMRDAEEIDAELFDLFLISRVWREYAETHMPPELRDAVDLDLLMRPFGLASKEQNPRAEAG